MARMESHKSVYLEKKGESDDSGAIQYDKG
jgi:hypothetical protein